MGIKLRDYLEYDVSEEEFNKLLYNMSSTMKYVHSNDYYIKSFDLDKIEIMDEENLGPIRYETVVKLENEDKNETVRRDIYNLAFIAIGTYSNTLNYLKPQFLKENFNEFSVFLPNDDIPYYRGIIERGSSVYYSDYVEARNKREIDNLDKELGNNGLSGEMGIQKKKATSIGSAMVDKQTEKLYGKLDDFNQSAFTSLLILPITMIILGIVMGILMLFL